MLRIVRLLAVALMTGVVGMTVTPKPTSAQDDQPLSPKQQDAVRKLVHDYILDNPGIVADAIDALREKEQLAAESAGRKALIERREEIVNDPDSPVLGDPKGDITLVEFFDYRDPYCKSMSDMIFDVVTDRKVRLVMKEWPILGPDSLLAAKAALAVHLLNPKQKDDKAYEAFHRALMHVKGPLTEAVVLKVAADAKIDVKRLKKDLNDPKIDALLKKNRQLAQALDITATPAFIINNQLVNSPMNKDALTLLIDQARKPKG